MICQVHEPLAKLMVQFLLVLDGSTTRSLDILKDLLPPVIVGGKPHNVSEVNHELLAKASKKSTLDISHVANCRVNFPPSFTRMALHVSQACG